MNMISSSWPSNPPNTMESWWSRLHRCHFSVCEKKTSRNDEDGSRNCVIRHNGDDQWSQVSCDCIPLGWRREILWDRPSMTKTTWCRTTVKWCKIFWIHYGDDRYGGDEFGAASSRQQEDQQNDQDDNQNSDTTAGVGVWKKACQHMSQQPISSTKQPMIGVEK